MESKHTPGPWTIDGDGWIVNEGRDFPICLIDASKVSKDFDPVDMSNARLIASAPELLEALYQAKEWLEGWGSAERQLAFIDAAIAKAEGRQP